LPLIGFAAATVAVVSASAAVPVLRIRYVAAAVLAPLLCALGIRTYIRNFDWRDNVSLWSAAIQTSPASFKPHIGLATALQHAGNPDDLSRSITEGEKALAIMSQLPPELRAPATYARVGTLSARRGDVLGDDSNYRKALAIYRQAIEIDHAVVEHRHAAANGNASDLDAAYPAVYTDIGGVLLRLGRTQEALDAYMQSLRISPDDHRALGAIADILSHTGKPKDALRWAAQAMVTGRTPEEMTRFSDYYREVYGSACELCLRPMDVACQAERDVLARFRDAHRPKLMARYSRLCGEDLGPDSAGVRSPLF
jgi:tetratricopeptide (TPR) repeat protein